MRMVRFCFNVPSCVPDVSTVHMRTTNTAPLLRHTSNSTQKMDALLMFVLFIQANEFSRRHRKIASIKKRISLLRKNFSLVLVHMIIPNHVVPCSTVARKRAGPVQFFSMVQYLFTQNTVTVPKHTKPYRTMPECSCECSIISEKTYSNVPVY